MCHNILRHLLFVFPSQFEDANRVVVPHANQLPIGHLEDKIIALSASVEIAEGRLLPAIRALLSTKKFFVLPLKRWYFV